MWGGIFVRSWVRHKRWVFANVYSCKMVNLSLVLTENQHYFKWVLAFVVISRHLSWKSNCTDKPVFLDKADSSLPLQLFWFNISGYHMMFYHIIWPSIPSSVYNCCLFSFQYYVTIFNILSKTIYEHLI